MSGSSGVVSSSSFPMSSRADRKEKLTKALRNSMCSRSVHTMLRMPQSMQQKKGLTSTLADSSRDTINTTINATV